MQNTSRLQARVIDYAENGFPLRPLTARAIQANLEFFEDWPENQRQWLKPDGSLYASFEEPTRTEYRE